MSRRLIVTADDFGDTPEVNGAVLRAYETGILRFASLMTLRPAAAQAAKLALAQPGLGVGLHLELCASEPEKAGARYFFSAAARAGLEGEIRSQIEAMLALGLQPTHIDGHINVHVHPVVFPAVCRLAREYGIPRVRLPAGEWEALKGFPGAESPATALLAGVFGAMGAWVGPAAEGLARPPSWGLLRSGLMKEDYVLWLLGRLPEGTTELYFHPTTDESLRAAGAPTPSHQSVTELETLLSPRVRRALEEHGVDLVSPAS
ncbi:MAG: ChbG/HpnK family deacetylase [Elusimicrobiota bacterium]|nr:ChbG/HpnK family deacetylase [Elusimicrobiota bacterium]